MNLVIFGDRSLRPTVTSMQMFVVVAEGFVVGYVFVEGALCKTKREREREVY